MTLPIDCIVSNELVVPFIVHLVKERLGLKPLLVTYNRYCNTLLGILNLAQLRRRLIDLLIQSVNPYSVKKIIRTTLRQLGSFHWPVWLARVFSCSDSR